MSLHSDLHTHMLTQQQRNHRRRRATPRQLAYLRKRFLEDPKPDQATREDIGRTIDMTPRSVQIWFQNNRAKTKDRGRKFSVHGKLYTMTTTACSENVSCIRADAGDLSLRGYDEYSNSFTPVRFNTPPPMDRRTGAFAISSPDYMSPLSLRYESPSHTVRNESAGGPLRYNMHYALSTSELERERAQSRNFWREDRYHRSVTNFATDQYGRPGLGSEPLDPFLSANIGSPISIADSVISEFEEGEYEASDSVYGFTDTDLGAGPRSHDVSSPRIPPDLPLPSQSYELLSSIEPEPEPYWHGGSSELPLRGTGVDTSLPVETQSFSPGFSDGEESVSSLDTCADADSIKIPCISLRIGQWFHNNDSHRSVSITVRYITNRQVLQLVVQGPCNTGVLIIEKDVLQFPRSYALQPFATGHSEVVVAVFGRPRFFQDHAGHSDTLDDPTDGEIFAADEVQIGGSFEEQLAVLQELENQESSLPCDWIAGESSPAQESHFDLFEDLITGDGIPMDYGFRTESAIDSYS